MHSIALVIYGGFLIWVIYNILMFVIFKQRYKEFSIVLYYANFLGLFLSRIVCASLQMEDLNNAAIRDTLISADCFSICIGIAHVSLVGDLIITLLFFHEQAQVNDRLTITDTINAKLEQIERKTRIRKIVIHTVAILSIIAVLIELVAKFFLSYGHVLIILNSELLIVGIALLIEIILFLKLSKSVFGDDFIEE